jgi:hypothetical protein
VLIKALPKKRVINDIAAFSSIVSSSGGGSVTVDAVGQDFGMFTSGPVTATPINIGASANALVVFCVFSNVGNGVYVTSPTATWDSTSASPQAMTIVTGTTQNVTDTVHSDQTVIFGLLNPHTGSKTLSINWSTNNGPGYTCCMSFIGANSTFGTAFQNGNTATATSSTPSISITSGGSQVAAAIHVSPTGVGAGFASVNQTQMFIDGTGAPNGAGNYAAPGSASVTLSGVINNSAIWASAGLTISP